MHELILGIILILLFGEFIPFTKIFWQKVGVKIKTLGEWFLETYENNLYSSEVEWKEGDIKKIRLKNFFAKTLFFLIAAIIVAFLEIFWELGFKKTANKFKATKLATWFEKKVKEMNKYVVLLIFGIPFILMEGLGVFAATFLLSGHYWIFIILYAIKFMFFIPVHFILHVGEEQLMSIPWFKRRYEIVIAVLEWFKKSQTYVRIHNFMDNIGAYVKGFKKLFTNSIINMDKAFKGEDILSEECEAIRQEILSIGNPKKELYMKFFECINSHI